LINYTEKDTYQRVCLYLLGKVAFWSFCRKLSYTAFLFSGPIRKSNQTYAPKKIQRLLGNLVFGYGFDYHFDFFSKY
jgi:hypothetical protein